MIQGFLESLEHFRQAYVHSANLQHEESISLLCSNFFYKWDYRPEAIFLYSKKKMEHPKLKANLEFLSKTDEKILSESNPISCFRIRYKKDPQLSLIKLKKKKDIILIDLTGSFIQTSETFRSYNRFGLIQYLCLRDCGITEFPKDLTILPRSLKSIDLSKNFLSAVPNDIKWMQLESLNLSENSFYFWPEPISPANVPNLISIDFSINSISTFPSFDPFPTLEVLLLDYNLFVILPSWIESCSKLRYLSLRGCFRLTDLSLKSLFKLTNLEFLDIAYLTIIDALDPIYPPANIRVLNCRGLTLETMSAVDTVSIHNIEDTKYNFFLDVVSPAVDTEFDNAFWQQQ